MDFLKKLFGRGSEPEPIDEEEIPPSIDRVKRRLMVFWANGFRAYLEDSGEPDAGETWMTVSSWVLGPVHWEMTERELAMHRLPFGSWSERQIIDASWNREAAVGLEWALGLRDEMPGWNEPVRLCDATEDFYDAPDPLLWRPELSLRHPRQIEFQAASVEAAYWRIRMGNEQTEYGLKLMGRASRLGQVSLAADGDLALADGRSVASIGEDELSQARSTASERLQGLNWLCGHDPDWDGVAANTIVGWLWDDNWTEPEGGPHAVP